MFSAPVDPKEAADKAAEARLAKKRKARDKRNKKKYQQTWFTKLMARVERLLPNLDAMAFRARGIGLLDVLETEDDSTVTTLQKLQMKKIDVDLLYTAFRQIDLSADGMVSLGEFYDYFECPKTPFTDMLFKVLDQDKSGDIDFKEFSIILWNYLSYDFKTLAAFTFSLWDTDKSQVLEKQEIIEMVTAVYGATRFAQNRRLEDVMKHLGLDGDGDVTLKEFQWMCRRYPLLIHPAHATQRMLRERVVSERYWHKLTRRRRKLFKDCTDIWDILSDDIAWGAEAASALPGGQKAAKIVRTHVPASLAQYFSNEDWGRYTSADAYATDVRDTVKNLDVEAVQKDAKVEQIKAMKSALAAEDGVGKMDEWQVTLLDETRKEFGGEVPDDLIVLPEMDVRAEMRRKGSEIGHFTAKDLKRSLDTAHDDDLTVVELDED